MDYEYITDHAEPEPIALRLGHLTSQQRVAVHLVEGSIAQLQGGTRHEQWTAALLTIACDAIDRGYEAELVALVRAWRREVEQGQ